jgi:hypothetical protein
MVGHIDAGGEGGRTELRFGFVQGFAIEIEQDETNASRAQAPGHSQPEAVGSAADHGDLFCPLRFGFR